MKRLAAWLLLCMIPRQLLAEPCSSASVVVTGRPATCDGVLLPEAWARQVLLCAKVELPRCRADAELAGTKAKSEARRLQTRAELAEQSLASCERSLTAATPDISMPQPASSWSDSPMLWAGLGLAAGLAVGVGVAKWLQH